MKYTLDYYFQACRGEEFSESVAVPSSVTTDSDSTTDDNMTYESPTDDRSQQDQVREHSIRISPIERDSMIFWSSPPG